MDVLSSVLREMQFQAAGYRRLELRAPWAIGFEQPGLRGIHIVTRGRCELVLHDAPKDAPAQILETGDLVIAPRADPHVLRAVGAKRAPVMSATEIGKRQGVHIGAGADGEETVIVCGAFVFHEADEAALSALPRILHVPGEKGHAPKWLKGYIDVLMGEALEQGPGSDVVMARLSSALVARALRFHVAQAQETGWLKGLQDPNIAKALAAMHDDFKRPWTLAMLAREAGLSRAAFAARFAEKVGETPMRYLLRRRMRHAITLLKSNRATLARIADRVGYSSEAALSAAFKRHTGKSPGAYR